VRIIELAYWRRGLAGPTEVFIEAPKIYTLFLGAINQQGGAVATARSLVISHTASPKSPQLCACSEP